MTDAEGEDRIGVDRNVDADGRADIRAFAESLGLRDVGIGNGVDLRCREQRRSRRQVRVDRDVWLEPVETIIGRGRRDGRIGEAGKAAVEGFIALTAVDIAAAQAQFEFPKIVRSAHDRHAEGQLQNIAVDGSAGKTGASDDIRQRIFDFGVEFHHPAAIGRLHGRRCAGGNGQLPRGLFLCQGGCADDQCRGEKKRNPLQPLHSNPSRRHGAQPQAQAEAHQILACMTAAPDVLPPNRVGRDPRGDRNRERA